MNVTTELMHIVEQAHSLERILNAAARVITERLRVDGCLVFLLDERGHLGIDSLSVVPTAIPALKQALAAARLEAMRAAMERILALSDARSLAAALREAQSA